MSIDAKTVKSLRERTGAGMMDCKKALMETNGDLEKAIDHLRKTGVAKAEKKGQRTTKEGLVFSYIHHGGKLGVLLELNCETDFVAKTEGFNDLAHNLAMQIAATNPSSISRDDMDSSVLEREKNIFTDQAKESGKPDNIIEKMIEGRLKKYVKEICVESQPFVKNPQVSVSQIIEQTEKELGLKINFETFEKYQF